MYKKSRPINRDNQRIGYNLRGAVLRYLAKNHGIAQKDIAASIGIHPVTFSRILNGEGTTISTVEKIANAVGADPDRILNKSSKIPKYTAKTLEEIVSDTRVLRQYIGETDRTGLEWANRELWRVVTALKNHRMKIQREQAEWT